LGAGYPEQGGEAMSYYKMTEAESREKYRLRKAVERRMMEQDASSVCTSIAVSESCDADRKLAIAICYQAAFDSIPVDQLVRLCNVFLLNSRPFALLARLKKNSKKRKKDFYC
jgi:hypothetical protein